jgi:small-conductance mechanosensitive channel
MQLGPVDALRPFLVAAAVVAAVLLSVEMVHRVVARAGRRVWLLRRLVDRAHRPLLMIIALLAAPPAVLGVTTRATWRGPFQHLVQLAVVVSVAWLVAALLLVLQDAALARFRTDVPDNRQARRVHTQVVMLRRFTLAAVTVVAGAVMLMTFPQARTVGASLLASAGIVGAVAALAAQSILGNVLAGLQLAFSDAVRLGDVVIVEMGVGADRRNDVDARGGTHLGRSSSHSANVLLHDPAVSELDPHLGRAAGYGRTGRGLDSTGTTTTRGDEPVSGYRQPVG